MTAYSNMSLDALRAERDAMRKEYDAYAAMGLKLDMSRGKPCSDQLDLCDGILNVIPAAAACKVDGSDARNYGLLAGLPAARKLFADLLGVKPENVIIGGNSSLNLMYDAVSRACYHGVFGGSRPWSECAGRRFLCPSPGYDRHFAITEFFGFENVPVPMTPDGPDMDVVERLVADERVKGIWCVPKYSNPDGCVYSEETIKRLASLKPAADDFRIFYDNAYIVHYLTEAEDEIANIFEFAREAGNENLVYEFASTSKMTYPGAGIACIAAGDEDAEFILKQMFYQTISGDKINQLRHVLYFGDVAGIKAHMRKLAEKLRPKFDIVSRKLEDSLSGLGAGCWSTPRGGYFISFEALPGCAKRIVALAAEAGIKMTGAGATWPGKHDPNDSNIRIAPSYPSQDELSRAMDVFCVCVRLASVEKLIAERE